MPTASEYREAATRLRGLGENVLRRTALVRGWPLDSHLGPGPVADRATAALDTVARRLDAAATDLARLARTCDDRAVVCEQYHARLAAHRALDPVLRAKAAVPQRPHAWVE